MPFASVLERREIVKRFRRRLIADDKTRTVSKGVPHPVHHGQPFDQDVPLINRRRTSLRRASRGFPPVV